jgi:23S rRNA (adenine2503-C2)-methyltransferase
MSKKINLLDLYPEELKSLLETNGEQGYRAQQIFQWLHKGIGSFEDMTNISKNLREKLFDISIVGCLRIKQKLVSKIDSTIKYLLEMEDGEAVECVLMEYKHGTSICISSQIGCRMGCTFCASTGAGYIRNLSAGEMLGQILTASRDSKRDIGHIVIMGVGEPLDNYDNIVKFLKLVNHPKGLNIGMRNISVSTCGLVPEILRLAEEKMQVTLSVSLHAPNNDLRTSIMPISRKYDIDKLISACKIYTGKTGRRITFEYAMVENINDNPEHALELAGILKGMLCHVNLIPVNTIPDKPYRKSGKEKIIRFSGILKSRGIETTVRRELGSDINAACGQLRRSSVESDEE